MGDDYTGTQSLQDMHVRFADDFSAVDTAFGLRNQRSCLCTQSFLAHRFGGDEGQPEILRGNLLVFASVIEPFHSIGRRRTERICFRLLSDMYSGGMKRFNDTREH